MSSAFTIKSARVDTLSVILKTVDISAIRDGLEKSFSNIDDAGSMPFLLDVHDLEDPWNVDIKEILQQFEDLQLKVIGVRHTDKDYAAKVAQYGLAFSILPSDNDNQETTGNQNEEDSPEVSESDNNESEVKPTLVIDKPVRSGQQIYARGGDVICTAAINQGADHEKKAPFRFYDGGNSGGDRADLDSGGDRLRELLLRDGPGEGIRDPRAGEAARGGDRGLPREVWLLPARQRLRHDHRGTQFQQQRG